MLKFVILILAAVCVYGLPKDLIFGGQGRIVGGTKAELGQFPYQAELFLPGIGHQCGGTILNKRWILTAAHCLLNIQIIDLEIKTGTTTLDAGGNRYRLDRAISHPDYNLKTKQNDVALVSTREDIVFGDNVQPIEIADYEVPDGADVVVSGWGFTFWGPGSKTPNDLYFANLKTTGLTDCGLRMIWWNIVTEDQICTFTGRGQGMCGGDSGGPLVHEGKLVGVVSWGVPCGAGYPDVYAKAKNYRDWINETIEKYN